MTITGSAPLIAIPTFIYLIITALISSSLKPFFRITEDHYDLLVILAILLILIGIMGVISVARKILKSFKKKELITDGLFRVCRNPMYASYVFFVIPGICLLFNSWLVLTTVIVNITLTLIFVPKEYKYLEETFGEEYKRYTEKVWIKII
jgi:protein-S-isoprenylcysteine O-methyltransferase Ste14